MNTNNMIKKLDPKILRRYLEAREIIDGKAERIVSIALMAGLLRHCAEVTVPVDVDALAFFADMNEREKVH